MPDFSRAQSFANYVAILFGVCAMIAGGIFIAS